MSTAASWIRYGIGIDESQEIATIATDFALIQAKGAWYTISCLVDHRTNPIVAAYLSANDVKVDDEEAVTKAFKFQGMEKLVNFLNDNQDLRDIVIEEVRELF